MKSHWYLIEISLISHWKLNKVSLISHWHLTDTSLKSHWHLINISLTSHTNHQTLITHYTSHIKMHSHSLRSLVNKRKTICPLKTIFCSDFGKKKAEVNEILLESELRHWRISGGCEQKCLDRGEVRTLWWHSGHQTVSGPSTKEHQSGGLWRQNMNWRGE